MHMDIKYINHYVYVLRVALAALINDSKECMTSKTPCHVNLNRSSTQPNASAMIKHAGLRIDFDNASTNKSSAKPSPLQVSPLLSFNMLYHFILYCILYCIMLYCILLYCSVFYLILCHVMLF